MLSQKTMYLLVGQQGRDFMHQGQVFEGQQEAGEGMVLVTNADHHDLLVGDDFRRRFSSANRHE